MLLYFCSATVFQTIPQQNLELCNSEQHKVCGALHSALIICLNEIVECMIQWITDKEVYLFIPEWIFDLVQIVWMNDSFYMTESYWCNDVLKVFFFFYFNNILVLCLLFLIKIKNLILRGVFQNWQLCAGSSTDMILCSLFMVYRRVWINVKTVIPNICSINFKM